MSHNPEFSNVYNTTQFSPMNGFYYVIETMYVTMYVTQPKILWCMSYSLEISHWIDSHSVSIDGHPQAAVWPLSGYSEATYR